jgi:hypothetical protein
MPVSGTLVTTNGMEIAASGIVGRATDFGLSATGHIDRIEVTKVATPDMPANAIGVRINMITSSGFSRRTPLLTHNVYDPVSTLDGLNGPRNQPEPVMFRITAQTCRALTADSISPPFIQSTRPLRWRFPPANRCVIATGNFRIQPGTRSTCDWPQAPTIHSKSVKQKKMLTYTRAESQRRTRARLQPIALEPR